MAVQCHGFQETLSPNIRKRKPAMTAAAIMQSQPVTLRHDDTISRALDMLLSHRVANFPVVDGEGRFIGQFGTHCLLGLLLPKAAILEEGLEDLAFLGEGGDQLRERLRDIREEPVGRHVNFATPVIQPEAPLMETVLLAYRHNAALPVVDEPSGRLVGTISPWDLLAVIGAKD